MFAEACERATMIRKSSFSRDPVLAIGYNTAPAFRKTLHGSFPGNFSGSFVLPRHRGREGSKHRTGPGGSGILRKKGAASPGRTLLRMSRRWQEAQRRPEADVEGSPAGRRRKRTGRDSRPTPKKPPHPRDPIPNRRPAHAAQREHDRGRDRHSHALGQDGVALAGGQGPAPENRTIPHYLATAP